MICNRCGSKISKDTVYCQQCGNNVGGVNSDETNTYTTENSILENSTQSNNILNIENNPNQSIDEPIKNLQNTNSQNLTQPLKTTKQQANFKNALIGYILIVVVTFIITFGILVLLDVDTDTTNNTNTDEIQLTKTYTNEEVGISFNYPKDWEEYDNLTDDLDVISLKIPSKDDNTAESYINKQEYDNTAEMYIYKQEYDIDDLDLSYFEPYIETSYLAEGFVVQEIIDTQIDGVDAKQIVFTEFEDTNYLGLAYEYIVNGDSYLVVFNSSFDEFDENRPLFDAIMASYKITPSTEYNTQQQNIDDYGLSSEEALEVAQQFIDTHPLYERTVTGDVEYEPDGYDYSTEGLYKINLLNNDGQHRYMWVDKKTGSVFQSFNDIDLVTGEEFYNAMFVSAQNRDEIYFEGIKISDYLGSSVDDVYDDFGPPTSGTDIDGSTFTFGDFVGYKNINFVYDEDIEIIEYIVGKPKEFTYKGVTLDKSRDELVELLGTPLCEAPSTNNTEQTLLQFSMGSYIVKFVFKSGYNDTYNIEFYLDSNKWIKC